MFSTCFSLKKIVKPKEVEIIPAGHFLEAAKMQHLLCKATGANPPAVITWWMNNVQLTNTETLVSSRRHLFSISFLINPSRHVCQNHSALLLNNGFDEDERGKK